MPIRAVHQPDRYATAVGEEAAFGADLAAVLGILAHLFPGGLWSSPHPSPATPSQPRKASYSTRPCSHKATKIRLHPLWKRRWAELLEQICVSFSAFHWHPCGARTRWHPWLCDHQRGADGIPKGVVYAVSTTTRSHNASGIRQSRCAFSWSSGISEAPGEDGSLAYYVSTGYHHMSLLG